MIPRIFKSNETEYDNLGLGALTTCIDCHVTEQLNGAYELELTCLATDPLFEFVSVGNIITVNPNMTDPVQPFIIESVTKKLNGEIEVYATHMVQYRTRLIPIPKWSANSLAGAINTLNSQALENNPFTLSTNMVSSASFNQNVPKSYRDTMGGTEGSLRDTYGGEYYYDRFNIYLLNHRGRRSDIRVMYGRNMTEFSEDTQFAWNASATGVLPFWANENGVADVVGDIQYSQYVNLYPYKRTVTMDFSEYFEEIPTKAELEAFAQTWINNKGLSAVTLECSFDQFDNTDARVNTIQLGDTVTVINALYNVNYESRIVETDYNVLAEKYNHITVGDLKTSINEAINKSVSSGTTSFTSGGGGGSGGTTDYNDLSNKPSINGVTLQGNITIQTGGDVNYYGTCTTAASTVTKSATVTGFPTTLTEGQKVSIKFTNANSVANPTLSINGGTAIAIKRYGTTAPSTSAASSWNAGSVVSLTYDGTYWMIDGWLNTTYSAISQANIENVSGTSTGLITGTRFTQALNARMTSITNTEIDTLTA